MNKHVAAKIATCAAAPVDMCIDQNSSDAQRHSVRDANRLWRPSMMNNPLSEPVNSKRSVADLLHMLEALCTIWNEVSPDDATSAALGDLEAQLYEHIGKTPSTDISGVAAKLAHVIDQVANCQVDLMDTPMVFNVLTSAYDDLLEIEKSLPAAGRKDQQDASAAGDEAGPELSPIEVLWSRRHRLWQQVNDVRTKHRRAEELALSNADVLLKEDDRLADEMTAIEDKLIDEDVTSALDLVLKARIIEARRGEWPDDSLNLAKSVIDFFPSIAAPAVHLEEPWVSIPPADAEATDEETAAPAKISSRVKELWIERAQAAFLDEPNDLDCGLLAAPAQLVCDLVIKGQVLILKKAMRNDDDWSSYVEPVLRDLLSLFPLSPAEPQQTGGSKIDGLWARCLEIDIGDPTGIEELLVTPAEAARDLSIKAQMMLGLKNTLGRYLPVHVEQLSRDLIALPNLKLSQRPAD